LFLSKTGLNATLPVAAANFASAPLVVMQPQGQSASVGATVVFSITASGTPPLGYQWRKDGTNRSGATNSTLTLANVQSSDAGNYNVIVSNAFGSVTSSNAALMVSGGASNTAPAISSISNQSTAVGVAVGPINFTVGDAETAVGGLTVTGTSTNQSLVPNAGIAFGGSGANRTVTVTPAANQTGATLINLTVSDGSLSSSTGFVLTVTNNTARLVRVVNASGSPGSTAAVPIEVVSQGDENAVGFSLTFDTAVVTFTGVAVGTGAAGATMNVNSNQVSNGRVGLAMAMGSGQVLSAGTRQVAVASFTIAASASFTSTVIAFGDQPVMRQVSDASAQSLPANYQPGVITLSQGYEADVAPRPNGNNNGTVSITDWVQTGRFAAGLDTVTNASEFLRADCAPRLSGTNLVLGNGTISITDWVQAGRYAAGLDPVTPAGGPTSLASGFRRSVTPSPITGSSRLFQGPARTLRLVQSLESGKGGLPIVLDARQRIPTSVQYVRVELEGQGNENAAGFSVQFNPAALRFVEAQVRGESEAATLMVNQGEVSSGRVGLALALPSGQTYGMGQRLMVEVGFVAREGTERWATRVQFGDEPVRRELVSVLANDLAAEYAGGTLNLAGDHPGTAVGEPPFKLEVLSWGSAGGVQLRLLGEMGGRYRMEVSEDLASWQSLRTVTLMGNSFEFVESEAGNSRGRYYRAVLVP
jgi:hypothetical protein